MSRSGYSDECEFVELWRGAVQRATDGKRGQQFFRELLAALDAMPVKELIAHQLEEDGAVCAIGSLGRARGVDLAKLDPTEPHDVADAFNIAPALAQEVVWMNDEYYNCDRETPAQRWTRMRAWVGEQIKATA